MKPFGLLVAGAFAFATFSAPAMAAISPDNDPSSAVSAACGATPTLDATCVAAVCGLVSGANDLPRAYLTGLGQAIAQLVADYGDKNAAGADEIQACVAKGPARLVAAFEGKTETVAVIGKPKKASDE